MTIVSWQWAGRWLAAVCGKSLLVWMLSATGTVGLAAESLAAESPRNASGLDVRTVVSAGAVVSPKAAPSAAATVLSEATAGGEGFLFESRLPDAQEARLRKLARELRCLVCQNESLAESHAALAGDLREEIRDQIRAGSTDEQVVQYLVARYGDFVTYRPPFNARTLGLWMGPFVILLLLALALWSAHRRTRTARNAPSEQESREIRETVSRLKRQYGNNDE